MLKQGHRGLPDGTKESTVTLLLQGIDGLVGQSGSSLLEGLEASIEVDEAELEVQGRGKGLKNPATGLYCIKQHSVSELASISNLERATYRDDLPSDTVSGDETYEIPGMSVNCRATESQNKGDCTNAKCPGSSHFDRLFCRVAFLKSTIAVIGALHFVYGYRIIVDPIS